MPCTALTELAGTDTQYGLHSHGFISDGAALQETVTKWQCLWLIWAQLLWVDRNDMRINTQHDQTGSSYHSIMRAFKVRVIERSLTFNWLSFGFNCLMTWSFHAQGPTWPIKPIRCLKFVEILSHSQDSCLLRFTGVDIQYLCPSWWQYSHKSPPDMSHIKEPRISDKTVTPNLNMFKSCLYTS